MLYEIDLNYLMKNQITAHEFIILKLLNDGELKRLRGYLQNSHSYERLEEDCTIMYNKGFLVEPPPDPLALSRLKVSKAFRSTLAFVDDPFDEFYDAFPVKVLRPDGNYDYLRVDHKRSKKIYHNIIRMNNAKHQFILDCLKAEVKDKESKGQMSFFKRMPTWLTSESWKAYADLARVEQDSTQDENNAGYGTEVE